MTERTTPSIWRKHNLTPRNYTVLEYIDDREGHYDLTPPYQRGAVWALEQRQALIRSMLMGVPVGAIVVNRRGYDAEQLANTFGSTRTYGVVDGRQRLETIRAFHAGGFSVPADWWEDAMLAERSDDGMVTFDGLSKQGQRAFENLSLASLVAEVPTLEAEAEIFLLINQGGTDQDAESIARAERVAGGSPGRSQPPRA